MAKPISLSEAGQRLRPYDLSPSQRKIVSEYAERLGRLDPEKLNPQQRSLIRDFIEGRTEFPKGRTVHNRYLNPRALLPTAAAIPAAWLATTGTLNQGAELTNFAEEMLNDGSIDPLQYMYLLGEHDNRRANIFDLQSVIASLNPQDEAAKREQQEKLDILASSLYGRGDDVDEIQLNFPERVEAAFQNQEVPVGRESPAEDIYSEKAYNDMTGEVRGETPILPEKKSPQTKPSETKTKRTSLEDPNDDSAEMPPEPKSTETSKIEPVESDSVADSTLGQDRATLRVDEGTTLVDLMQGEPYKPVGNSEEPLEDDITYLALPVDKSLVPDPETMKELYKVATGSDFVENSKAAQARMRDLKDFYTTSGGMKGRTPTRFALDYYKTL